METRKKQCQPTHADTDTNQQVILLTITKYAKIGNKLWWNLVVAIILVFLWFPRSLQNSHTMICPQVPMLTIVLYDLNYLHNEKLQKCASFWQLTSQPRPWFLNCLARLTFSDMMMLICLFLGYKIYNHKTADKSKCRQLEKSLGLVEYSDSPLLIYMHMK